MARYEALLIGGRSGVGKSTVGWEVSELLDAAGVTHCVLDGDYLGHVVPPPPTDPHRSALTERNLAAVWANFTALGHRRLIYTNTVSVLEEDMFRRALGGDSLRLVKVLLTATNETAAARLGLRETGTQLAVHLERSARAARRLAEHAPPDTVTVATDGRSVLEVACEVVTATGW
ncbi:adenylyl-sulfate kinase [Streptomyces sp. I05A-00742]|uniref:adenylyl-sulfate kinase n=1 Tax=Streptomyces sp. I05A-00742 TaxID=2732853 RepID=UPI001487D5DD|nr:adenylyl-sulfate kinase [Streptomyces sp. I05A-00742]